MSCNIKDCTSGIGILCKSCDKRPVFCFVHGQSHLIELNHQVTMLNRELIEKNNLKSSFIGKEIEISKNIDKIYLIISELKKLLKDKIKEVKSLSPYPDGNSQEMNSNSIIDMLIKIEILPDFQKEIKLQQLEIEGLKNKLNDCTANHSCISEMIKNIQELEQIVEENKKLTNRIPDNDGKLTNLEAKIQYCIEMNSNIPKLKSQISCLEGNREDCDKNLSNYSVDITKYIQEITTLKSSINVLQGNREDCRKNHLNYSVDITKYIQEIAMLKSNISDLEGRADCCRKNHSASIAEIKKLREKLGNIKKLRKIVRKYDEEKKMEDLRNESKLFNQMNLGQQKKYIKINHSFIKRDSNDCYYVISTDGLYLFQCNYYLVLKTEDGNNEKDANNEKDDKTNQRKQGLKSNRILIHNLKEKRVEAEGANSNENSGGYARQWKTRYPECVYPAWGY